MARDSLYSIMKEFYLWYDMPEATSITESNKGDYKDPYELLEAMRYKALDRWSIVSDYDALEAIYQGTFAGHGFRAGVDYSGLARIVMIYKNSPLYANGVRRGWIIKKINNTDPAPLLISEDPAAFSNLIGPSQAGVTNIFQFQKPDGTEVTISSAKSTFTINTVLTCDTLNLSSGVTGHLVLEAFIDPTRDELTSAFEYYWLRNIKDIILDLRYNSGGYLGTAGYLASYIGGPACYGKVFEKLQYNDKQQKYNYNFNFETVGNTRGFSRVVIITSRGTASASEALINGLKPFVNVVTIGDTTDGKPVGTFFWPIYNKYIAAPCMFKISNAENQGDYYDGFFPDKVVPDDITHDFSDREEFCLKEAIYYLETGSVSTKGGQLFKRNPVFSEKPEWMNNAIISVFPPK